MPPITSPLFIEAQAAYEAISRRLNDISEYQLPRLRDCKGPLPLQQKYAAELRDDTEGLAKRLEDFSTFAEDQERENERAQVRKWVSELYDTLTRLRSESRTALLASKRAIDHDARSRRDELLDAAALRKKREAEAEAHKQRATEDKLMAATDDVTEALRRTTRLMQQELERSVLSVQMLEESSKTLRATSDAYTSIDGLMDISQVLIKALQRADWMDRIIIGLSFGVFVLTLAYIIKKRVLDRVVSVATLPIRLAMPSKSTGRRLLSDAMGTAKTMATSLATSAPDEQHSLAATDTIMSSSTGSAVLDTLIPPISAQEALETFSSVCSDAVCEIIESTSSVADEISTAVTASVIPTLQAVHQEL